MKKDKLTYLFIVFSIGLFLSANLQINEKRRRLKACQSSIILLDAVHYLPEEKVQDHHIPMQRKMMRKR